VGPKSAKARQAYNLAARRYDDWSWQRFWRLVEAPLVLNGIVKERPSQVLDIGCGTGWYLNSLLESNIQGVGLDISEGMLDIARERLGRSGLLVQGDARALPFKDRAFSCLLMARVLSHISETETAIDELSRELRSTGTLWLTDVHPQHAYEATRLPFGHEKILVETYKHEMEELIEVAWRVGKLKAFSTAIIHQSAVRPELALASGPLKDKDQSPVGYMLAFRRA
jgi:ubiquinone/menaquinone biosynthesis C-methylase UbiE